MKDAAIVRTRTLPMWSAGKPTTSPPRPPAATINIGLRTATLHVERTAPRR